MTRAFTLQAIEKLLPHDALSANLGIEIACRLSVRPSVCNVDG